MVRNGVTLRSVDPADLDVFYAQANDPTAIARANVPPRSKPEFYAHWRNRIVGDPTVLARTVCAGDAAAGYLVSWWQDGHRTVGYWLGREFWGQGVGTAALLQFLSLEVTRPLYADTDVANTASRRLLERCGFKVVETRHADVDYVIFVLD